MKLARETPSAINKPLCVVGIERISLCVVTGACFLMAQKISWWLGGGAWLALCAWIKIATRNDPDYFRILWIVWRFKQVLDPIRREIFRMEIIDD
jgi:hypothetical protein